MAKGVWQTKGSGVIVGMIMPDRVKGEMREGGRNEMKKRSGYCVERQDVLFTYVNWTVVSENREVPWTPYATAT